MLAGLLALALPVWLHLRPRRGPPTPFPAVDLLRRVAIHRASRLRLRRFVLLVSRLLAIAALVLAAARPALTVVRPGGIRAGAALALAVVLDDSLSMLQRGPDGTTAFEDARAKALLEIDRLRPGDAARLVLSGRRARAVGLDAGFDIDATRHAVKQAAPSRRGGDLEGALRLAARFLEESPLPQREVVVVTDLSEKGWRDRPLPWTPESGIGFRVVRAGPPDAPPNLSVDEVRAFPAGEGTSRDVVVEVLISNHSDAPRKDLEVMLELEGQVVARGTVDLEPRAVASKRFHHRFEAEGLHQGRMLIPADALPEDDGRSFAVVVRRSLDVLVVSGDPRPGSHRDEAFYLRRALETATPGEVPIRPLVVDLDAAVASPLAGHDVVFLAGVEDPPAPLARRLEEFVRGGGGLFVSPGAGGIRLEELGEVLPAVVRSVRQNRTDERPFRVSAVNRAHPIFQPFEDGPSGLEQVEVHRQLLVEPNPMVERIILAEATGGVPLLLERRVDRGRAIMLTTTLDRDWTDMPIRPGYLPLVQRSARYLAGRLDDMEVDRVEVGRPLPLEIADGMQRLVVVKPDGVEVPFTAKQLAGISSLPFLDTAAPGCHRVWADIPGFGGFREIEGLAFLVETDPAESDLDHGEPLAGLEIEADLAPVEGHLPMWPYLLLLGVVALLFETAIAAVGLRRSHL